MNHAVSIRIGGDDIDWSLKLAHVERLGFQDVSEVQFGANRSE